MVTARDSFTIMFHPSNDHPIHSLMQRGSHEREPMSSARAKVSQHIPQQVPTPFTSRQQVPTNDSQRPRTTASALERQPAPSNDSQRPRTHTGDADRRQGTTTTTIIVIVILTSSTHHVTRFQWEVSARRFDSMNTIRSYLCSLLPSRVH
jgi:hypothetical protein